MNEIDSLLRVSSDGIDLKIGDSEAMKARVEEWLHTPQGSVYGLPGWGNPLVRFKHEPMNTFVEVALENAIIAGLRRDIVGINLQGISVTEIEKDLVHLAIYLPYGELIFGLQKS